MTGIAGIGGFGAYLRANGLAATTVRAYLGHVRAMLRAQPDGDVLTYTTARFATAPAGTAQAIRHALRRWLDYTGAGPVALPTGQRTARRERDALTADEVRDFELTVRAADLTAPIRTILLLLPLTGLRIQEACQLRVSDVIVRDGARGLFIRGKGRHERFVPLLPEAVELLDGYGVIALVASWGAGADYLFPGRAGGHVRPDSVRARLRELRARREVIPHVLRHTFATRCLHGGMPLPTLQRILGHADLETTAIYLHVRPLDAAAALRGAWSNSR